MEGGDIGPHPFLVIGGVICPVEPKEFNHDEVYV